MSRCRKPIALYAVTGCFLQLLVTFLWPTTTGMIVSSVIRGVSSVLAAMVYAMVRRCSVVCTSLPSY